MAWTRMPISEDYTWCRQGLMDFRKDYPDPPIIQPKDHLAFGLQQMQDLFESRRRREANAMADMALQRLLYDQEKRNAQCALALLLQPHEFFQSPLFTREDYIHACLFKVLVEQNVYNYSPFLTQSTMTDEMLLNINIQRSEQGLIADLLGPEPPVQPRAEKPVSYKNHMAQFSGLTCYGDWFKAWGPPLNEEPSSTEVAMTLDQQQKLLHRGLGRRRRRYRDSRPEYGGLVIPQAMHQQPGVMIQAEVMPYHNYSHVRYQQTQRITLQETYQWFKY